MIERQWRLFLVVFVGLSALFAYWNSYILLGLGLLGVRGGGEKIQDGSKGKDQSSSVPPNKIELATGWEPVPYATTVPFLFHGGMVALRSPQPVLVDGKPEEWRLEAGSFFTIDYQNLRDSQSVWVYTMYDDQNFYIFYRVRDRYFRPNFASTDENPCMGNVLQCQLWIDQPLVINSWIQDKGQPMVQLFYLDPDAYPNTIVKERYEQNQDNLLVRKHSLARVNGIEKGARVNYLYHIDKAGMDWELAIPWRLLCRNERAPTEGSQGQIGFACLLGENTIIGQLKTVLRETNIPYNLWFLTELSYTAFPVALYCDKERRAYFPVQVVQQKSEVQWDYFQPDYIPIWNKIPLLQLEQIEVDGQPMEWPKNQMIIGSDHLFRSVNGIVRGWLGYDRNGIGGFFFVEDPTPLGIGDKISLSFQHPTGNFQLQLSVDQIVLNGNPLSPHPLTQIIWKPDERFSRYQVEFRIAKDQLPITFLQENNVTVSIEFFINSHWVFSFTQMGGSNLFPQRVPIILTPPDPMQDPYPLQVGGGFLFPIQIQDDYTVKRVDRGFQLRVPYSTDYRWIDVPYQRIHVDANPQEWDLRAGILICNDILVFRENNAAWFYLAYDEKFLYALFLVYDPTPLQHHPEKMIWSDDLIQLRVMIEEVLHYSPCYWDHKREWEHMIEVGCPPKRIDNYPIPPEQHGILLAHQYISQPLGYIVEIGIPWKWFIKQEQPPKPSTEFPVTVSLRTSPYTILSTLHANPSVFHFWWDCRSWGKGRILPPGVSPRVQPIPLYNGQRIPVRADEPHQLPQPQWDKIKKLGW